MTQAGPRRFQASWSQRLAIDVAGATVVLLGLLELTLVVASPGAVAHASVLLPVLGIEYAVMGWCAWWRRTGNLVGPLLIVAALSFIGSGLTALPARPLVAVGLLLGMLPLAVVVHLLHAFPSGRLRGLSRAIVLSTYVVTVLLEAPTHLLTTAAPPLDVLRVADAPRLLAAAQWVQNAAGVAVLVATACVLWTRLSRLDEARRRVLGPVLGYGFVAILAQPVALHLLPDLGVAADIVPLVQLGMLAGAPLALVLCLLLGGYGRTSEVHELGAWLGAGPVTRSDLAQALRTTLGDRSLELWFHVRGSYVDADGDPVEPEEVPAGRGLVEVDLAGELIGAISYDAGLITDPRPVVTAGRVIALAVDRERLTTELLATRASLRRTLSRVVESADTERRRIARNLHDGLQSRLVLLGMNAYQLEHDPTASDTIRRSAADLRVGVYSSVDELRRLVAGLMPATLLERGLYAAAEDFVSTLPIDTRLTLEGEPGDLPSAVESTAYFVLTEAVANALKHARASRLTVSLESSDDSLRITVSDDGVGGASGARHGGLAGLADRVGAMGGTLDVLSGPGQGTRLFAEVPCGS